MTPEKIRKGCDAAKAVTDTCIAASLDPAEIVGVLLGVILLTARLCPEVQPLARELMQETVVQIAQLEVAGVVAEAQKGSPS